MVDDDLTMDSHTNWKKVSYDDYVSYDDFPLLKKSVDIIEKKKEG